MRIAVREHYSVAEKGDGSLVTVEIEFKNSAVTMGAGKIKDATTTALTESLRKLVTLVA